MSDKILNKDECYQIQGAVFEVYREMGCGFLEAVYQECMEKELRRRGIPFEAKRKVQVIYKGEVLEKTYEPDLICYEKIIVELKAVSELAAIHKAQVINYLKATRMRLGLLVNFGSYPKAEVERLIL